MKTLIIRDRLLYKLRKRVNPSATLILFMAGLTFGLYVTHSQMVDVESSLQRVESVSKPVVREWSA